MGDDKSELSLLSCRGSLFIQLYPSSPITTHMLTLRRPLHVATVLQVSRAAIAPAAATVSQQGALFDAAFPYCVHTR